MLYQAVGVDIWLVHSIDEMEVHGVTGPTRYTNWAGDSVLVVPASPNQGFRVRELLSGHVVV